MDTNIAVLYVDDEPINVMLFKANFKNKFNLFTANSGKEGLQILQDNSNIQVVVSDMKMPELNGIEFIRLAAAKHKSVSYFILTGFDITPAIAEALDEGLIHKYFRKPFNIKEIEGAILNVINVM